MKETMIPAALDMEHILKDLKAAGWLDQKLETACGLGNGYIKQLRSGRISRVSYVYGARLYNLWIDESVRTLTLRVTTT